MAANFLKIDRNKIHGNRAVELANTLVDVRAKLAAEYETLMHMFDGEDFSMVEQHFGLEEGKGLEFYVLLGQVTQVLTGTDDVPGPQRRQQLDDFTARIGGQ